MQPEIDRVYVNKKAIDELGWNPKYDFGYLLNRIESGNQYGSELSKLVGIKNYHSQRFEAGPYPVNE